MTENHDETRRLREAFAATSPEDLATADCPPAERIWEAVTGELGPAEARQMLHHVASCPVCTEAWRLASEIEGGQERAQTATPRPVQKRRAPRWGFIAAAAAAVLAVVVIGENFNDFSTVSTARSGAPEELSLLTEGTTLTRSSCQARWLGVEGATYDVQVLTESLEVLAERKQLRIPEFTVPAELFEGLAPDKALLLRIEARQPRKVPTSRTVLLPC